MKTLKIAFCLSLLFLSKMTFAADGKALVFGQQVQVELEPDLIDHLQELSASEKLEQLRDWMVYAFFNRETFTEEQIFKLFFDYSPLRHQFKKEFISYDYGPSRSESLATGELYIFVPQGSPKKKVFIARKSDSHQLLYGERPKKVYVIEYKIDPIDTAGNYFVLSEEVPASTIFSESFGYYKQVVRNRAELTQFLSKVDDICEVVETSSGQLNFAGRKFRGFPTKGVDLEDLAALFQADNNRVQQFKEQLSKRQLSIEYESYVASNVRHNKETNPYFMFKPDFYIEQKFREEYTYQDFYDLTIESFLKQDLNIGFSLDPELKNAEFSSGLKRVLSGDQDLFERWFDKYIKDQVINTYLLGIKKSQEQLSDLKSEFTSIIYDWQNRIDFEQSPNTFLFGSSPLEEVADYKNINRKLQSQYQISDSMINNHVNEHFHDLNLAISQKKEILSEIADSVALNKMLPYYRYKTYLNGTLPFKLSLSGQSFENLTLDQDKMIDFLTQISMTSISQLEEKQLIEWITDSNWENLYSFAKRKGINADHYFNKETSIKNLSILEKYIVQDLVQLVQLEGYEVTTPKSTYDEELSEIVADIQDYSDLPVTGDLDQTTFRLILNRNYEIKAQFSLISSFLFDWHQTNSFQKARYDGYLQGTKVGMNLFYTDLVMKLWGFNYEGSAPDSIVEGFQSKVSQQLDFTFYEELQQLTGTRSWLNVLDESYEVSSAKVLFAHNATQIFNASNNDLYPGSESPANLQSFLFADWWNKNYSRVADYDQEFHRLNQIMKWTIIISWLKEKDKFSFLDKVFVFREHDFEKWYAAQDLVVSAKIPFLQKEQLNEDTECFEMIASPPHFPFKNYDIIYRFSGGVSLPAGSKVRNSMKITPKRSVMEGGVMRKGIDHQTTRNPNSVRLLNGRQIDLSVNAKAASIKRIGKKAKGEDPNSNSGVLPADPHAKKRATRASNAQLNDVNLEFKYEFTGTKTSINENTPRAQVFRFNVSPKADAVNLSYQPRELLQGQKILSEMQNNYDGVVYSSSTVSHGFRMQTGEYMVKPTGSTKWLQINISKSSDPLSTNADIRVAKNINSLTEEMNYYNGKFISEAEFAQQTKDYRYIETTTTWEGRINNQFSATDPGINANTVNYFSESKGNIPVKVQGKKVYVENNAQGMDAVRAMTQDGKSESLKVLTSEVFTDPSAVKLIYEGGEVRAFSNGQVAPPDISLFRSLLTGNNSSSIITRLVIKDNAAVKLIGDNILQVPRNITPQQRIVAESMLQRINTDARWTSVFKKAQRVTPEDMTIIKNIEVENVELGNSYFKFKEEVDLLPNYAVVDYGIGGKNVQMIVLDQVGKPKLINSAIEVSANISKLKEIHLGKQYVNYSEYMELTAPIAKALEQSASSSGKSNLLLVPKEGIRETLIHRLHFPESKAKVFKDQIDLNQSLANTLQEIYPELQSSFIGSTVPLNGTSDTQINKIGQELYATGIEQDSTLTIQGFQNLIADPDILQLFLIVRSNESGIVFRDRVLTYERLQYILETAPEKEFLYILSNNADHMQKEFAESKKFKMVISSNFKLKAPDSFRTALSQLLSFVNSFAAETVQLSKKAAKVLTKKVPDLARQLGLDRKQLKKINTIEIGKLTADLKRRFSRHGVPKIAKYFPAYQLKTLDQHITDHQKEAVAKMQLGKSAQGFDTNIFMAAPEAKWD